RRTKRKGLIKLFSSTSGAVTCFWYESTDAKGLIGELTVDAKAARHGGARGRGAALAQAELKGSQSPSAAAYCRYRFYRPILSWNHRKHYLRRSLLRGLVGRRKLGGCMGSCMFVRKY
ncbi:LOW QUALITY PROTEIN: hypothetical protein TorRG33x02_271910, partial [Trema orientale]